MRAHITPDEFWIALQRFRDGGWTDEEILEQVRHVVVASCKRWLVEKGYIQPEDNPMTEYIHLRWMETSEGDAIVDVLRGLDTLYDKLYTSNDIFGATIEAMRIAAAMSYVGLTTEELLTQKQAEQKVKSHLDAIRLKNKKDHDVQEVINMIFETIYHEKGKCRNEDVQWFIEDDQWEEKGYSSSTDYDVYWDKDDQQAVLKNKRKKGEPDKLYKLTSLNRYITRARKELKKK